MTPKTGGASAELWELVAFAEELREDATDYETSIFKARVTALSTIVILLVISVSTFAVFDDRYTLVVQTFEWFLISLTSAILMYAAVEFILLKHRRSNSKIARIGLNEVTEIIREVSSTVAATDDWSPNERARFTVQMSRFSLNGAPHRPTRTSQNEFDVLISYSTSDRELALRLTDELRRCGVKPWLDANHIRPGNSIEQEFDRIARDVDSFVVLISSNTEDSQQDAEIEKLVALRDATGKRLIPVVKDAENADLPASLSDVQWLPLPVSDSSRRRLGETAALAHLLRT